MSTNIYARETKLPNVVHRIFSYLANPDRQEKKLFGASSMSKEEWKALAKYETDHQKSNSKNNQAREIMLVLPNNLKDPKEVINEFIDKAIGKEHPWAYVVHQKAKGKEQDNLHVHIVFSERTINKELKQKTYKRDIWYDKTTNKLSKTGVGEIIHHKGDLVFKDNQPVYENEPYSTKDTRFKEGDFLYKSKLQIKDILNNRGYDFKVFNNKSPYLKQKHIYKDYTQEQIKETKAFNEQVKQYNKLVDKHLEINKNNELGLNTAKHNLFKDKNIPLQEKIKQLSNKLSSLIQDTKEKIREVVYSFIAPTDNCKLDRQDNLIVYEWYNGFGFDIKINNGDYIIPQEIGENIEIGVKKGSHVEITDKSGPEFMRQTKKGDENLLINFHNTYKDEELDKGYDRSL